MTGDPESEAVRSLGLLPCPACGAPEPACRPDGAVRGCVFRCLSCDATAFARGDDQGWRDGAFAWNRWVRKARAVRKKRKETPDA